MWPQMRPQIPILAVVATACTWKFGAGFLQLPFLAPPVVRATKSACAATREAAIDEVIPKATKESIEADVVVIGSGVAG